MYPFCRFLYFISIVFALPFVSCNDKPNDDTLSKQSASTTNNRLIKKDIQVDSLTSNVSAAMPADTILNMKATTIDGTRFTVFSTEKGDLYSSTTKGKIKLISGDFSADFELKDFNEDGLEDITVNYITNTPGIQDVLLYDKLSRTFKLVTDMTNFPDPIKIPNTQYYYSYHKSGCADMNWGSDLFIIKNYKTIRIGNITGCECNNEGIKDGVYIFRIGNGKKQLIKQKPISVINNYKDYKWGFIKSYWTANYKFFM